MENLTVSLTPEMLALIPVVAAIIQLLKRVEAVKKLTAWLPFAAIGIALGLNYYTNIPEPVLPSIIIGLVASGGYDLLKGSTGK